MKIVNLCENIKHGGRWDFKENKTKERGWAKWYTLSQQRFGG